MEELEEVLYEDYILHTHTNMYTCSLLKDNMAPRYFDYFFVVDINEHNLLTVN